MTKKGKASVKKFPPYQDGSDDGPVRSDNVRKRKVGVARLSVASNTVLLVLKLVFGFMMGSISVISEGVHSGMDLLAAIIAMLAVQRSTKPADQDHHYGHGKYEAVSGTAEAILIFLAAGLIIFEAVRKFLNMEGVEFLEYGIVIMLISVVVNILVSRRLMKVAKETDSIALEADALHLSTDVWTSAGVMVGLVLIRVTGIHYLDPIVAVIVAILIIKTAYDLTKRSFKDLVDTSISPEEQAAIVEVLQDHDHVIHDYHKLRTRKSGPDRHIDVHIVVSRELGLEETHALNDHVEAEIKKRVPNAHVLIHSEPCDGICDRCDEDEVCEELRRTKLAELSKREQGTRDEIIEKLEPMISGILCRHEEFVTYHDLEISRRGDKRKLTLHAIVKADMTVEKGHDINHELEDKIQDIYPDMEVIIHLEPCNGKCEECEEDCPEKE